VKVAVVGHVEWCRFVRVEDLPRAGQIVHATEAWEEPAGGGAVAAAELARLNGEALFFTALGDDELGRRAEQELERLGIAVLAAWRAKPQRIAVVHVDAVGERAITVVGEKLAPRTGDDLPWGDLDGADGVYFTAGDPGALRAARGARVLVATPRAGAVLTEAGIDIDALVFSDEDDQERAAARALTPEPALLVATRSAAGGSYSAPDGATGTWEAAPPPGPIIDSYGSGDSFAAALCWALAEGRNPADSLGVAARAGAFGLTGRGPYGRQLTGAEATMTPGSRDAS